MRTTQDRANQYDAKVDPATIGLIVAARLPKMKEDFASTTNSIVQSQMCTLDILNEDSIVRIRRGRYYAFCNEMWKLVHASDVAGPAAILESDALAAKWVAFGCLLPTLVKIAFNCFNITLTPIP